ncbi:sensor histidine kinase [Streptomyces sp. KL118A]|uniref:sensor histidine kinase n=1 Tax=Streptomyces sp. KL118A TaxID=3045153 RepID=UPI00278C67CA|nr:histidine kinase [Streptomyces sp. KL118A]
MDDHRSPSGAAPTGPGHHPAGPRPRPRPRPRPGLGKALLFAVPAVFLWLLDLVSSEPDGSWLPLVSGPLAVAVLLVRGGPGIEARAAAAALASGALTLGLALGRVQVGSWGLLESFALLALLTVTTRTARLPAGYVLCALLALAVAAAPVRTGFRSDAETFAFVLTVAAGGALALGGYLRSLDGRRALAVSATQEEERRRIARDLHDFVAHHVTGIVVQAQAARAIRDTSPEQLEPLLAGIEKAGTETLESMRRLVHVLRAEPGATTRPAGLLTELAALVAAHGDAATLEVSARVRAAALAPEVETSVHRVVQEALTNVTRHAPGADGIRVRVAVDEGQLVVEVSNGPSAQGRAMDRTPPGGRGGLGLIGLRERVSALGGGLEAGPLPDGGWRLRATLPAGPAS